jgi:hypothetical protein
MYAPVDHALRPKRHNPFLQGNQGLTMNTPKMLRLFGLSAVLLLPLLSAADAQAIKCSTFMHATDGSWRSFETTTVLASRGPVKIEAGETFRRGGRKDQDDIATILDGLCGN